jgi:hypothetical protein
MVKVSFKYKRGIHDGDPLIGRQKRDDGPVRVKTQEAVVRD